MKFKRSYSKARNLGSAYKFAFGGDINRAIIYLLIFETNILRVSPVKALIDSRCQSFTAQWCISPMSLREALLDARFDTVTHRATKALIDSILLLF